MPRFTLKLAATALLSLPLLLTGCMFGSQSQQLRDVEVSYLGGPLPEQAFNASQKKLADEQEQRMKEPSGHLEKSGVSYWLLPGFFQIKFLDVEPTHATTYRGTGLSLILPLRLNYQEHYYAPGSQEPIGSQRAYWTPIWANAIKSGQIESPRDIHASGVPILWSTFRVRDNRTPWQVKGFNTLWTLGPASVRGKHPKIDGYFTAPLSVLGLGIVVWSDTRISWRTKADSPGTSRLEWHGPLAGYLGYRDSRGPEDFDPEEGSPSTTTRWRRLILGGLAWYDGERHNAEGEVVTASHGPLWSAFGWGRKDGRDTIRVFGVSL